MTFWSDEMFAKVISDKYVYRHTHRTEQRLWHTLPPFTFALVGQLNAQFLRYLLWLLCVIHAQSHRERLGNSFIRCARVNCSRQLFEQTRPITQLSLASQLRNLSYRIPGHARQGQADTPYRPLHLPELAQVAPRRARVWGAVCVVFGHK